MSLLYAIRARLRLFLRIVLRILRQQKFTTFIAGVVYKRNPKSIEIDITYRCNLKCLNCNRSCGVAPTTDEMTVSQIKKFVDESIRDNAQWEAVRLLGGEPTLNPNLMAIIDVLLNYKAKYSSEMSLELLTNGSSSSIKDVLSKLPKEILITNAHKDSPEYDGYAYYFDQDGVHRVNFHNAPKDHFWMGSFDYSNGCFIPDKCGIGLSAYGYYCCSTAPAIDRIFGFNIGRKELPAKDDLLLDQRRVFCRLCGHFIQDKCLQFISEIKPPSRTWQDALVRYNRTKPKLDFY